MRKIIPISLIALLIIAVSCGGGENKDDAVLSDKGKLLTAVTWKYDTNASIKGTTDEVEDTTGISADIELKKDVKVFADFLTGTLAFGVDAKDKSKLSYERKYGKGILSTSVLGFWNFNEDETVIVMREWDNATNKEKPPVNYEIIKLTDEQLIIKEEGGAEHFYIPK